MTFLKIIATLSFVTISGIVYYYNFFQSPIEEIVIKIDEHTPPFEREIICTHPSVHNLKVTAKGTFNDTIISSGQKDGRLIWDFESKKSEYYGYPPIKISYERYKATEVDLTITYSFYGY